MRARPGSAAVVYTVSIENVSCFKHITVVEHCERNNHTAGDGPSRLSSRSNRMIRIFTNLLLFDKDLMDFVVVFHRADAALNLVAQ